MFNYTYSTALLMATYKDGTSSLLQLKRSFIEI